MYGRSSIPSSACFLNAAIQALFLTTLFLVNLYRFDLEKTQTTDELFGGKWISKEVVIFNRKSQNIAPAEAANGRNDRDRQVGTCNLTSGLDLSLPVRTEVNPINFVKEVSVELFPRGSEHDANEFLRYLWNTLGGQDKVGK